MQDVPPQPTPSPGPAQDQPSPRPRPGDPADHVALGTPPLLDDPDETVAEVEVEEILDRPAEPGDEPPGELDPEAGRGSVASKSVAIREAVGTPFGRLLLALPLALAGIALAIMAATHQTWPYIAAAAVVAPVGMWLVHRRYQDWLGHRRYIYRLLETLGEDVSDFDPAQSVRPVKAKGQRRTRR